MTDKLAELAAKSIKKPTTWSLWKEPNKGVEGSKAYCKIDIAIISDTSHTTNPKTRKDPRCY
jgi:hypothetical protein